VAIILVVGSALLAIDVSGGEPVRAGTDFERLDAYVQHEANASRIPGVAVAVVQGGQTVHARGFGTDGRGHSITPDTPFWIGSLTKSFTALSVMQLVESGKVDLDAPIQRYVPYFRVADAEASGRITVRHLLNQTSGFSRADGIRMVFEGKDQGLQDAVAEMASLNLNRPVGESYQYSNLNFVVLGLMVETVSGQSWTDYVQHHIFEPLAMTHSYATLQEAEKNGLTATHRQAFGFPLETEGQYPRALAPTGYLYSAAGDMARYLMMYSQGGLLDGRRVLSQQGIAEMLQPATNVAGFQLQSQVLQAQYGEGWFVGPFGSAQDARWHQGSLPYFTAWMALLPSTGQAVVVLMNAGNQFEIAGANSAFSRLPQGVVDILVGEQPAVGLSVRRFFIIFNTVVVAALSVQLWSLVRRIRNPIGRLSSGRSMLKAFAPLLWELGVAGLIIAAYPAVIGTGWLASFAFVPDLTLVIASIAILWLMTGVVRLLRLANATYQTRSVKRTGALKQAYT
jgi:CubicO group peptidase (beta-lactamase class C family)